MRSQPAQGYPLADLADFPTTPVAGRLHRAHRGDVGPWWFSSYDPATEQPACRFDLPRPRGTCYLASTAVAAARERLGSHTQRAVHIDDDAVASAVVSALDVADWGDVADLDHGDAPLFGVTAELSSSGPYALTAAWAAALDDVAAGIRYPLRFGIPDDGYALFSAAGADAGRPSDPQPVPMVDLLAKAGYELLATPHQLPVVPPPV